MDPEADPEADPEDDPEDQTAAADIPSSFDLRDHPIAKNCRSMKPRWQQDCGACWSFSVAAMVGTRLCMLSGGKIDMRPGPADIIASVFPWNKYYRYVSVGALRQDYLTALSIMSDIGMLPEGCAAYQCSRPNVEEVSKNVIQAVLEREKNVGGSTQSTITYEKAAENAMHRAAEVSKSPTSPRLAHIVSKLTENRKSSLRTDVPEKQQQMVSQFSHVFMSKLKSGRAGSLLSSPKEASLSSKPLTQEERETCKAVQPIQIHFSKEHPVKIMGDGPVTDLSSLRQQIQREIMKEGPITVGIDMGRVNKVAAEGELSTSTSIFSFFRNTHEHEVAAEEQRPAHFVDGGDTSISKTTNHAVIVIGWRPAPGATDGSVEFLIQNSWNAATASNFFYVSEKTLPFDLRHKWLGVHPKLINCPVKGGCETLPGNL